MMTLYFEDLKPGRVFKAGPVTVDPEEVSDFARRYDPQDFHLDEEAGRNSVFGGTCRQRLANSVIYDAYAGFKRSCQHRKRLGRFTNRQNDVAPAR